VAGPGLLTRGRAFSRGLWASHQLRALTKDQPGVLPAGAGPPPGPASGFFAVKREGAASSPCQGPLAAALSAGVRTPWGGFPMTPPFRTSRAVLRSGRGKRLAASPSLCACRFRASLCGRCGDPCELRGSAGPASTYVPCSSPPPIAISHWKTSTGGPVHPSIDDEDQVPLGARPPKCSDASSANAAGRWPQSSCEMG